LNTQTFEPGYYYLHTNGQIILKSFYVVDCVGPSEYFDSPFVVTWGKAKTQEEYNALITKFKELS
jgi:hypothetical protein